MNRIILRFRPFVFFFQALTAIWLAACIDDADRRASPLDLTAGTWVDLTYPFDENTIYWPTDTQGFHIDTVAFGPTPQDYFYSAFAFCSAEHGGTHLDAPIHFAEGKKSVEALDLDQLIGPAVIVDVSQKAMQNRDLLVTVEDITNFEEEFGLIPDQSILLFRTGYGKFWPDRNDYLGTDQIGPEAIPNLHFPGLDPEAATWLVRERNIKAVGLDTPSIDFGQSRGFEAHRVLFAANIPAFENLANLDRLPATGAWIIALPMAIAGGSGAPLRAVAWLPSQPVAH